MLVWCVHQDFGCECESCGGEGNDFPCTCETCGHVYSAECTEEGEFIRYQSYMLSEDMTCGECGSEHVRCNYCGLLLSSEEAW